MTGSAVGTVLLAGAVLLSCAGGGAGGAAGTPGGPDLAVFSLAPSAARYRTVSVRNNVTAAMGQSTALDSRLDFTARVSLSGSGNDRSIEIVIDTVARIEGQMLLSGSRQEVTGVTLRARISRRGELSELELDPVGLASDPIVGQISATFQQYFPRIPAGGVRPGMVWTDSTTVARGQNGADIVLEAVTEFTAGSWTDTTSRAELVVEWIRDYTVSGEGEQMGQAFTISGTGRSTGRHRFRADGTFLGSSVRDSSASDINVTSLGMTVPLSQTGVDSVTILP